MDAMDTLTRTRDPMQQDRNRNQNQMTTKPNGDHAGSAVCTRNRAKSGLRKRRKTESSGTSKTSKQTKEPTIMNYLAMKPKQQAQLKRAQIVIRLGGTMTQMIVVVLLLFKLDLWQPPASEGRPPPTHWAVQAVSVQRLQVPDLVVIDQQQQQYRPSSSAPTHLLADNNSSRPFGSSSSSSSPSSYPWQPQTPTSGEPLRPRDGPQAASLINSQPLHESSQQQQQITFECLIGFDRKKDKNLIVKWHHDERSEPIYQWIPELNKRSIAPQYRAYIAPITGQQQQPALPPPSLPQSHESATSGFGQPVVSATTGTGSAPSAANPNNNQIQLLEAGFRLIRPTKELGGKYTCSAISSQNDDSKSKKMIVYTPPKSFRFNATRADIGALLASQRDRLIQMTQPAQSHSPPGGQLSGQQLPLVYRMRGLEQTHPAAPPPGAPVAPTTISPQMYSTIDYVNVNQQRTRQQLSVGGAGSSLAAATVGHQQLPRSQLQQQQQQQQQQQVLRTTNLSRAPTQTTRQQLGVKLVCDIDQVFPVPEVSIYRLAKLDGSHPEKLAKLDTRIERDVHTGLFHVQVTSILDDDDLQAIRQGGSSSAASSEPSEVYFECLIALTNLELSKYADNKRSIIYRPGQQLASGPQVGAHNYQQQQQQQQQQQDLAGGGSTLESPAGTSWSAPSSSSGQSERFCWPTRAHFLHMVPLTIISVAIIFLT